MLFSEKIKELRRLSGLLQRQLAAKLDIDTPMYSKIERGERYAKREQVIALANLLKIDKEELLTLWLSDKIICNLSGESTALAAIKCVEKELIRIGKY